MVAKNPAAKNAKRPETADVHLSFAPVVRSFSRNRNVSRKRMFSSNAVLSANGKIFAMHVKGRLVVKLPKNQVDALVARGTGERFDPGHGRLMKEWVSIPEGEADWIVLAKEAYVYACRKA